MMKNLVFLFALAAVSIFAAVAPVAPSAQISAATTNTIAFPADAVGNARVVVAQTGATTNAPTVFALYTFDANTNAVPVDYTRPVTNHAGAVELWFPAPAVKQGKLSLVTTPGTTITRAAVLVYRPKYGR